MHIYYNILLNQMIFYFETNDNIDIKDDLVKK